MYKSAWWFKRRYASVGDIIVISVKDAIPKGKVKGQFIKQWLLEQERKFIEMMAPKYNLIKMQ